VESRLPFDTHPIYALLHEAIYCQGEASNWSAHRVAAKLDAFKDDGVGRFNFTGEMVYPWMFADYRHLQPLAEAADILAMRTDWPALYDVERTFSAETADAIGNMRTWVTNEFDHNGLRTAGPRILDYLLDLISGER
jgi:hypothetical protein